MAANKWYARTTIGIKTKKGLVKYKPKEEVKGISKELAADLSKRNLITNESPNKPKAPKEIKDKQAPETKEGASEVK